MEKQDTLNAICVTDRVEYEKGSRIQDYGNLTTSDVSRAIDEWIFSERDRALLKRRLIDHITLEKLAEEFDLSVRQVKNIVRRCEIKIFSKLNK